MARLKPCSAAPRSPAFIRAMARIVSAVAFAVRDVESPRQRDSALAFAAHLVQALQREERHRAAAHRTDLVVEIASPGGRLLRRRIGVGRFREPRQQCLELRQFDGRPEHSRMPGQAVELLGARDGTARQPEGFLVGEQCRGVGGGEQKEIGRPLEIAGRLEQQRQLRRHRRRGIAVASKQRFRRAPAQRQPGGSA